METSRLYPLCCASVLNRGQSPQYGFEGDRDVEELALVARMADELQSEWKPGDSTCTGHGHHRGPE